MGRGRFLNQKIAKRTGYVQLQQQARAGSEKGSGSKVGRAGRRAIMKAATRKKTRGG